MALVNDPLLHAYRRTSFSAEIPSGRVCLRIGQVNSELDAMLLELGATMWAHVTAFNPGSVLLEDRGNLQGQLELERAVVERGYRSFSGEGVGDDRCWPPERAS
jgi:hypothetical protein